MHKDEGRYLYIQLFLTSILIFLDNSSVPLYNVTAAPRLKEWRRMYWSLIAGCILTGIFLRIIKDRVQVAW